MRLGNSVMNAREAWDSEEPDIQTGVRRGTDKGYQELSNALDAGVSLVSGALGLPFWAVWYQGKGLYNWTKDDYRLMTHLETEKARLERQPEVNESRLREIDALKERINATHRLRERGLLSKDEARTRIVLQLRGY